MAEHQPPEPIEPAPEQQPQEPEDLDYQDGLLDPPDSETPDTMANLAAWQHIANEPPMSIGEGVIWRPGQSVSAFWRNATKFIASIAAQDAHEHPDDPEAQRTYNAWLERVKKLEE